MATLKLTKSLQVLLILITILFSKQVGKVLYKGAIDELKSISDITVPQNAVAMSDYLYMESPDTTDGSSGAPAIMFVIDNSGSMKNTDGDGNRYSVVQDLIDSLDQVEGAQVGISVFQKKLAYDKNLNQVVPIHNDVDPNMDSTKTGGYVPLLDLDSVYNGIRGADLLKSYLKSNPSNGLLDESLTDTTIGTGGTNINIGMLAVKDAMDHSSTHPRNRYAIFFSDGEATQNSLTSGDDFAFEDYDSIPTMYTIFFTKYNSVPSSIKNLTENLNKPGYSNGYNDGKDSSQAWPFENNSKDSLEQFIVDNVISKIVGDIVTQPSTVTINGKTFSASWLDSTGMAKLDGLAPLTGTTTQMNYNILYERYYDTLIQRAYDTVPMVDSTYDTIGFDVHIDVNTLTPTNKIEMAYWDRNLEVKDKGSPLSLIDTAQDSIEISFDFDPLDAEYNYTNVSAILATTVANDSETVVLTKVNGENRFHTYIKLKSSITSLDNNTIVEHRAIDTLTVFFRNSEKDTLPLDTLSERIPINTYIVNEIDTTDTTVIDTTDSTEVDTTDTTDVIDTVVIIDTTDTNDIVDTTVYTLSKGAALFDKNGDGYPDLVMVSLKGGSLAEIRDSIAHGSLQSTLLPNYLHIDGKKTKVSGGGLVIPIDYDTTQGIRTSRISTDIIKLNDTLRLSGDAILLPFSIELADSMAPVALNANLSENNGTTKLAISMSEPIKNVVSGEPFNFIRGTTRYHGYVSQISNSGQTLTVNVDSVQGVVLINTDDSLNINIDNSQVISDTNGVVQRARLNRRAPITAPRPHTIKSAALFDTDADGFPDELKLVVEGSQIPLLVADFDSSFISLPSFITFDSITNIGDTLLLAVTYKDSVPKTSLHNDYLVVDKDKNFSGGQLKAAHIEIIDSMAPVIVSAIFIDEPNEVLTVEFSEPVSSITAKTPFNFYATTDSGRLYTKTMKADSAVDNIVYFTVDSSSDVIINGDSVNIKVDNNAKMSDTLGIAQINANNRKVAILATLTHRIISAAIFDTDADGYGDLLRLKVFGTLVKDLSSAVENKITLPNEITVNPSKSSSITGNTIDVPIVRSTFSTKLDGETITSSDTITFGNGGVLVPFNIVISDSMAPVIESATLIDSVYYKSHDNLYVVFSEDVSNIYHNTPFEFISGGKEFTAQLTKISQTGDSAVFEIDSIVGNFSFSSNDSIYIKTDKSDFISDTIGNKQINDKNRRVELRRILKHEYIGLDSGEIIYYDKDADGTVDYIKLYANGRYVSENAKMIADNFPFSQNRDITIDSARWNFDHIDIWVESDLEKTDITQEDYIDLDSTMLLMPIGLSIKADTYIPVDSMAPVIISAEYKDSVTLGAFDILKVTFSEKITPLHSGFIAPFVMQIQSNPQRVFVFDSITSMSENSITLLLGSDKDTTEKISEGDSIWINTLPAPLIRDINGVGQYNKRNIKRALTFEYVTEPYTLKLRATLLMEDEGGKIKDRLMATIPNIGSVMPGDNKIMIISIIPDPKNSFFDLDYLEGRVTIFDAVGNVVASNLEMVFDRNRKELITVWDGKNESGREVGNGAYVAIAKVKFESYFGKVSYFNLRTMIGVRKYQ